MLALFRDGFGIDIAILVIISVLLGGGLAAAIAAAVDGYFSGTLSSLIGKYGEYDLIIHVREETADAALEHLQRVIDERFPGSGIRKGVTVAGKANFLISLARGFRTEPVLSNLSVLTQGLPGEEGYTLILQPSITVSAVQPGSAGWIEAEIEKLPEVDFAFKHGRDLIVIPDRAEDVRLLTGDIEEILNRYQVLEVRFPGGLDEKSRKEAIKRITESLSQRWQGMAVVTLNSEQEEDMQAFMNVLSEMKRFLLEYASRVVIKPDPGVRLGTGERMLVDTGEGDEPVEVEITGWEKDTATGLIVSGSIEGLEKLEHLNGYRQTDTGAPGDRVATIAIQNKRYELFRTIDQSVQLLEGLKDVSQGAGQAITDAKNTINRLREAVVELEALSRRYTQLRSLAENDGGNVGSQLMLGLLLNELFGDDPVAGPGGLSEIARQKNADDGSLPPVESRLDGISARLDELQVADVDRIIDRIQSIRQQMPHLTDAEIARSVRLLDRYIQGQVVPVDRAHVLVEGRVPGNRITDYLSGRQFGDCASFFIAPAGVINPDARTELVQVLSEVRGIIAGLVGAVWLFATLILDYATIFSAMRSLARRGRHGFSLQRWLGNGAVPGMVTGGTILMLVFWISDASLPGFKGLHIILLGAVLGCAVALLSDRVSPVNEGEIMAGEAMGFSYAEVMRQIVIPDSRPGLLSLLNKWRQKI